MKDQISEKALARFLVGLSDAAEEQRIRTLLEVDPDLRIRLEGVGLQKSAGVRRDADQAVARLTPASERRGGNEKAPAGLRLVGGRLPLLRVAAAIAVLLAVGVLSWMMMSGRESGTWQEFATARGERSIVTLPDGSTVELNMASTLRVSHSFSDESRDVELTGSAFFSVAEGGRRPFTVRSDGVVVEVIGTTFGLDAYAEGPSVQVVVETGTVSVQPPRGPATLVEAGEMGRVYRLEPQTVHVAAADPAYHLAWREGRLVFHGETLPRVGVVLGRWFDVDIAVDRSVSHLRLDATFEGESLHQVLESISAALPVTYRRASGRITITEP